MAYTASFSVSVGDPTKASDVTTLAANDDFLKAAVDAIMHDSATPTAVLKTAVTTQTLHAADDDTLKLASTSFVKRAADAAGISFSNDADDRVVTGTGSGINGEANLTFDGSTLTLAGNQVINDGYGLRVGSATEVTSATGIGEVQINGTGNPDTQLFLGRWAANLTGPTMVMHTSRSGTVGGTTIVQDGDYFGQTYYTGSNGSNNTAIGAVIDARVDGTPSSTSMPGKIQFATSPSGAVSPTVRMVITSGGNVGIGGVTPDVGSNGANDVVVTISNSATAADHHAAILELNASTSTNTAEIGKLAFTRSAATNKDHASIRALTASSDADAGAHMAFLTKTLNSGIAERMRINSAGDVSIGTTNVDNGGRFKVLNSDGEYTAGFFNSHGSTPYGLLLNFAGAAPDNNTQHFLHCSDTGGDRLFIYADGDVANHDGTYGTISDVKFKQDIVDVRSYWDDFKSLQYRKFRHKTDVAVDADAPYRLGLIAQEVETIFPALVPESPDGDIETEEAVVDEDGEAVLDEDGNPTYETISTPSGTTHKWVKSSIVEGPIMGSVVQELQTRLEAAEAKITALESA